MPLNENRSAFSSADDLSAVLETQGYVTDSALAMALFLALRMAKPLLLEGEPGVGKTEVGKVLAAVLDAELIRLQCYEGIDLASAAYEWNYLRQLLYLRAAESSGAGRLDDVFRREFLIERPLLRAISGEQSRPCVLLIDEIDRADDEFEAFLLELLSDYQISIPELGTVTARRKPVVVVTSNRTREIHDALKRRCLYAWLDYPTFEKELRIVRRKVPEAGARLAEQICLFTQTLRRRDLFKLPGVSETLDWAQALVLLGSQELDEPTVTTTIGCLVKYQEDLRSLRPEALASLVAEARRSD